MRYLIRGNAADIPLTDESVHCVVTSPPYWSLRKYAGEQELDWPAVSYAPMPGLPPLDMEPMRCALGLEPDPESFIAHLVLVFREVYRVLRNDGVAWVVIGDSYFGSGQGWASNKATYPGWQSKKLWEEPPGYDRSKQGNLVGIPARLQFALQGDGWIVRNDNVWHKCLSGGAMVYAKTQKGEMPMTVKDMVRLDPSTVQLWDGEKWNQCVSFSEQEPHLERKELSSRRRTHKYQTGEELPVMGDIEIELRNGERIGSTREHRWPIEGLGFLVRAEDLKPGYILKSATLPEPEDPRMPAALGDDDIGWFVGMYLAEGSRDSTGTIQIASHARETDRMERLERIAAAYDGYIAVYQSSENGVSINLNSPILTGILDTYISGNTARYKHLHVRCWKRSNRFLAALLEGYLDGDGHWDGKRWKIGFCNNDALAADLRTLASRIGTSLRLRRCKHTMGDRQFPGWRGDISDPKLRRTSDYEIIAIRQSRARKFWEIALEDEPHLFALTCGVLTHNSNPMPESVSGWTWQRHRIKVAGKRVPQFTNESGYRNTAQGHSRPGGGGGMDIATMDKGYRWRPCPGCPTCEPHGGYVLRRGSWRHTRAHETILMCVKQMGYYANQEAVREPSTGQNGAAANFRRETKDHLIPNQNAVQHRTDRLDTFDNPAGRNPRSVLSVSSEPLKMAHYAAFPKALVAPLIRATCPARCCPRCGAGHAPIVEKETVEPSYRKGNTPETQHAYWGESSTRTLSMVTESNVLGYRATCDCDVKHTYHTDDPYERCAVCNGPCQFTEPAQEGNCYVPGTVLDPFVGSGTTLAVARELGLRGIGLDLSHSYLDGQAKVRAHVSAPSGALDDLPLFADLDPGGYDDEP